MPCRFYGKSPELLPVPFVTISNSSLNPSTSAAYFIIGFSRQDQQCWTISGFANWEAETFIVW